MGLFTGLEFSSNLGLVYGWYNPQLGYRRGQVWPQILEPVHISGLQKRANLFPITAKKTFPLRLLLYSIIYLSSLYFVFISLFTGVNKFPNPPLVPPHQILINSVEGYSIRKWCNAPSCFCCSYSSANFSCPSAAPRQNLLYPYLFLLSQPCNFSPVIV